MTDVVVDAHVHLWDLAAMSLSWFRPDLGLPEAATVDDYLAAGRAPARLIAVQAGDTLREARWLVRCAEERAEVAAVVLQYDARPGTWAGVAEPLLAADDAAAGPRRIAGIRLATPSGEADFADIASLDHLADGLARTGRVLELLVRPAQLLAAAGLAARHPELTVVVCHLGVGGAEPDGAWRRGLDAVAARENTAAKVSGLVRGTPEDGRLPGIVGHAVARFGPRRLCVGSDWPISARFAELPEVARRTRGALEEAGVGPGAPVWGDTAERLYGLGGSSS